MRFRAFSAFLLLISGFCTASAPAATGTVAVLPFFNGGGVSNLDWIGESVAETLRESFAGSGALTLTREDRVEVYHRLAVRPDVVLTRATVLRIGEVLDASQVIFGQFDFVPSQAAGASRGALKLTANVLDIRGLHQGPKFVESGPLEDLSLMESRLAWQCLKFAMPNSTPGQNDYLRNRPPVRIDAVESYVRGLMADSPDQRYKLFLQSAHLDARFSEPAFQLGQIAFEKKEYKNSSLWFAKVAPGDSHFHAAEFFLGLCQYYLGDYDGAIQALQRVAAEVPLNEVFNNLGAAQSRIGRPDALDNFRKALEGDEADPDYWFNLGYFQWKTGRVVDAEKSLREVLARTPDDAEASSLLARIRRNEGPKSGEALHAERIKADFEETAFLQLKAELKK